MIQHIRSIVSSNEPREKKARQLAEWIRNFGPYRWVGIYDVGPEFVSIIAYSGESPPAFPTFPATKGLTGAAIEQKATLIVGDVRKDSRYLATLGDTLSEIIVPIVDPRSGKVVGTVDVESEQTNAFSTQDRILLEQCVQAAMPLWDIR